MIRSRIAPRKRLPILESLERRETPASLGVASAWANSLRGQAITSDAVANPPSSNLTTSPDGSFSRPGTVSPDGLSITNSLRSGPSSSLGSTTPIQRGSNLTRGSNGLFNPPGTVSSDGISITNSLRRASLPGSIGTGPGVTTPSTISRFASNFLRSGPTGGTVVTSPGTVTGGGIDLGGSGGGSVTTPGVTVPSTTIRFSSNFLRTGLPGTITTPGVTVPSVTTGVTSTGLSG